MKPAGDYKAALAGRSVLLVDDEPIVVDVIRDVFEGVVSAFESASNGIEALAKIVERDFDFILLDVEMPKMNGIELFNYVSELKPRLIKRVIFITGDTETESTRSFIKKSGCSFLDKPFMLKDLFRVMASLDSGAT